MRWLGALLRRRSTGGRLLLTRDSVAMGDDVESHDLVVAVDPTRPLVELLTEVTTGHRRYLASISGGHATWIVRRGRGGEALAVVAQQWDEPHLLVAGPAVGAGPALVADAGPTLHFESLRQEDPAAVVARLTDA